VCVAELAEAFSCTEYVLLTPLAVDVIVAICVVLTADAVAVNAALVAPAGTVTEAGTLSAELLLASATANPPLGAAAETATAQASLPAPVTDALPHETPLKTGVVAGVVVAGSSWIVNVALPLYVCAVVVAVCVMETAAIVAEKVTLVEPWGTYTEEGTCTAGLLLESITVRPFVLFTTPLIVTVQESMPEPV